ncbi:hypothetical protein GCM10017600_80070 [Streptosporangium carneum]|uniref:Uncharacterized protein n=1 Tax=Streptosporangium carneum TaxID=47481 RepID=A0A9W6I9K4_9ACTN|nr:hypothetical protein GCM10017600_80070 [Streptosporangium carneum]
MLIRSPYPHPGSGLHAWGRVARSPVGAAATWVFRASRLPDGSRRAARFGVITEGSGSRPT